MPANQYLGFAGANNANTLQYAAYAALSNLIAQGFQNGIADPAQFNTLMRQVSTVSAGLAQFVADNQSADVLDDGVPGNFETKFEAALKGYLDTLGVIYVVDGGTADALSGSPNPAVTAYSTPLVIAVKKNASVAANQTTAPTINLNGLGAVTITKASGSALYAGDLPQGGLFIAVYDGTYFRHVGLTISTVDLRHQAGQAVFFIGSGSATAYTGTLSPAPTSLTPDMEVLGYFGTANTGTSPTLNLNGLGAKPLLKQGGGVPSAGDLSGFVPLVLRNDGGAWIVNGLLPSDVLALIAANGGIIRVVDTAAASTANALVGTATPAISGYAAGQVFLVTSAAANTSTTPSLNVTGSAGTALGALTLVNRTGSALAAGDIPASTQFLAVADGAGKARLLGLLPSDIPPQLAALGVAGATPHPYYTSGTSSLTMPATATAFVARGWGAGGGGGGASGTVGGGSGGGGGGYFFGRYVASAGAVLSIVIGTGGSGGTNSPTAGGAGGTTYISVTSGTVTKPDGTIVTAGQTVCAATGGGGGLGGAGGIQTVGGSAGGASGGQINLGGQPGQLAYYVYNQNTVCGLGGATSFGGGTPAVNIQNPGFSGIFPGGGANGGGGPNAGGTGASGAAELYY